MPSPLFSTAGTYTLSYNVSDAAENAATTVSRIVTVEKVTETQALSLKAGWNLVSFYVEPTDMSAATVLAPISSSLLQIKDLTRSYDPNIPAFLNTLDNLSVKDGYWVKVSEDVSFDVEGAVPPGASISVKSGWNLVGYPRLTGEATGDELTSLGSTVVQIKNLTKSFDPSLPSFLNTLTTMAPGSGYWLKVSANGTWTVGTVSESGAGRGLGKMGPVQKMGWGRVMIYPNLSATVLSEVSVGGTPVSGGSVVGAFVGEDLKQGRRCCAPNCSSKGPYIKDVRKISVFLEPPPPFVRDRPKFNPLPRRTSDFLFKNLTIRLRCDPLQMTPEESIISIIKMQYEYKK